MMSVFWCVFFVLSLLGIPKNAREQMSKQCWNVQRMCVFLYAVSFIIVGSA